MEKEHKKLCIYTRKDESEANFEEREHIIPACIGGMKRLEQGYVSDEVNHQFSKLELPFARESLVSVPRMFVGPGKRGSKNPKKKGGAGKKIAVMKSQESGWFSLGYIQMGIPIVIDQLHLKILENGSRQVRMRFDNNGTDSTENRLEEWMKKLDTYSGSPVIIKNKNFPLDEMILGLEGKRWYLAISKEKNGDVAKEEIKSELELVKRYYNRNKGASEETENSQEQKENDFLESGEIQVEKSRVTAEIEMAFCMDDYFRVAAKIAFNCLADIKGQDYVLQEKFDPIREAILSGKEIEHFVRMGEQMKSFDNLVKWAEEKGFGSWLHMIAITRNMQGLAAVVYLYGSASPTAVLLSEEECGDFGEMDGYICDWENNREMRLLDFIGEIARDRDIAGEVL